MDDPRAARPGQGVVPVDRLAEEGHLAGQVAVVRAGPRAGLDDGQPVPRVRTHGGEEHPRALGQGGQGACVLRVGLDEGPRPGYGRQARPDRFEPGHRPAGEPDPQAGGRVRGEVGGDQFADETGRSVEDEVMIAG